MARFRNHRFEMKADLAVCYGQERLPRYTSYPTAPHFSDTIGPATYAHWLKTIPQHATASLYLHVPFCRSMCWYCGCHTTVAQRDEPIAVYEAALRCEIELVSRQIERRMKVDHVHFGGGTPTIMAPESFTRPDRGSSGSPSSCCRRPRSRSRSTRARFPRPMIDALALGGVNRASLGVQSFDPVVQCAINRVQSFEETAAATENLRRAGISGTQFRSDLRPAAPDHRLLPRYGAALYRASARAVLRVRLRARADLQEVSAQDRREPAARQCRALRPVLRDRQCLEGGGLHPDRAGSFRAAVRRDGRSTLRRAAAPQLPGLYHRGPARCCSASAPAPLGTCRRAMCRTRLRSVPIRTPSPPAGSPPPRAMP